MADSSPGIWAAIASALAPIGVAAWAIFKSIDDGRKARIEQQASHDRDTAQRDLNESVQEYIDRLLAENDTLRQERDAERKSGLQHYGRSVRLYGELGRIVAGGKPPDTLKRMEDW